jgi:phage terminase large subunit-like protein
MTLCETCCQRRSNNDWSVCTTWIVTRDKRWYLLDVWRKRVDYPELKAVVETLAVTFRAQRVLVEDTGAGISLVQELRSRVSGIVLAASYLAQLPGRL